jgi:signal transduction histidine kinase
MGDDLIRERGPALGSVLVDVEQALRTAMHEIRQPVAAVLALAEAARGLPAATPDVRGYLDLIIEQVLEVSSAAASVLERRVGTDDVDRGDLVDVDEVLDSVLQAFGRTWSGALDRRGPRGCMAASGSRPSVRRCLVNVIDNAVRAAGPDGKVIVTVHCDARSVRVVVEDDGPGFGALPPGTGIGLAVTRRELQSIGGRLSAGLRSSLGGARVVLSLPLRTTGPVLLDPPVSTG